MMEVLQERRLSLSRRKTRMGCIKSGFHFLGIKSLGTQTLDNTSAEYSCNDSVISFHDDQKLNAIKGGGSKI
jgi:RNA-directed DNA polymerase